MSPTAALPADAEPWSTWRLNGLVGTTRRRRAGAANVALLHGALGDSARLAHLAPLLDDCNLAFLDLRGHGRSHRPATGYAIDELARETTAPLRHAFDAQPFVLIAESFSGLIGLALGGQLPELAHVFLIDTPFDTTRMQASHVALRRAHARTAAEHRPALEALCREFFGLDVETGRVTARRYHAYLAERATPSTVITGSRKASMEAAASGEPAAYFDAADLAAASPDADRPPLTVVEIEGGGHRLLKTHPQAVIQAVRRVLADSG
ncbi:MAG: alpha/beta hydrolase [Alphaproteobacteria bacterium]|nr:alpha/beta hydrolase [Alphaproteobacteria bacterium]